MALRKLLSRKVRTQLMHQSRYFTIDPDVDEDENLRRLKLRPNTNNKHRMNDIDKEHETDGFYSSDE